MAFVVRGALRRGFNVASTAIKHRHMHNQARDLDMKRLLRDLENNVEDKAKGRTAAFDTLGHPFRWFHELLGLRGHPFNPPGFWCLSLSFFYFFSFGTGVDMGENDARALIEEMNAEKKLGDPKQSQEGN